MEYTIQFTQDGKTPFNPKEIFQSAYHAVKKTGLYSLDIKEWRKKATTDQTWTNSNQVFAEYYHNLVKETKVTSGYSGFHSANAMQEIFRALEHLALMVAADKDMVTRITEAVEALTKKYGHHNPTQKSHAYKSRDGKETQCQTHAIHIR